MAWCLLRLASTSCASTKGFIRLVMLGRRGDGPSMLGPGLTGFRSAVLCRAVPSGLLLLRGVISASGFGRPWVVWPPVGALYAAPAVWLLELFERLGGDQVRLSLLL